VTGTLEGVTRTIGEGVGRDGGVVNGFVVVGRSAVGGGVVARPRMEATSANALRMGEPNELGAVVFEFFYACSR
jgi:hypothetical protein